MAMLQAIVFGYTMSWPQKLDHKLSCITEQFTEPVNWQYDGQETAAALDGGKTISQLSSEHLDSSQYDKGLETATAGRSA